MTRDHEDRQSVADAGRGGEPVGWLGTVRLEGSDDDVAVVLDGREGNKVFVRQVDPSEDEPARVPIFEGDELVVMVCL